MAAEQELHDEEWSALPRRPLKDESDLDITPMIDITFLLLIYFLVASTPDMQTAVEMPPAHYGKAVPARESVIFTVVDGGLGPAPVYLADGKVPGTELAANPEEQGDQIEAAVEKGRDEGKGDVLIKAERGVAHREVARVVAAVSRIEGVRLHIGVMETD